MQNERKTLDTLRYYFPLSLSNNFIIIVVIIIRDRMLDAVTTSTRILGIINHLINTIIVNIIIIIIRKFNTS